MFIVFLFLLRIVNKFIIPILSYLIFYKSDRFDFLIFKAYIYQV